MLKTMYILEVIPLAVIPRGQPQILSYFHTQPLPVGASVLIGLKRRKIKGVVIGASDIRKNKLLLKKAADFKLKNVIGVISPEPQVAGWQLAIADFLANYYFAPLGLCLKTVLPPFWGKKKYESRIMNPVRDSLGTSRALSLTGISNGMNYESRKIKQPEPRFIETDLHNHGADYSSEIEKHLKSGRQVFLMTAEKTAANYFFEKFRDLKPDCVSSGLSVKEHYEIWQNIASGKTKLIIGTRVGLFLPFNNLGLIIVDDESNETYKSDMTPRYHAADLASEIARIHGAEIVSSAVAPRLETWNQNHETRNMKHETHDSGSIPLEIPVIDSARDVPKLSLTGFIIQDMVQELRAGNFSIFSRDLQDILLKIENLKLKIILYVPRRGHANFILCQTCGQPFTCPNCSASLVPHTLEARGQKPEARIVCHHCDHTEPWPKQCPNCGGYHPRAYGIGLEKVIGELKKFFQYQNIKLPEILRLDSDWVKTEAEEKKVVSSFQENQGAIMVATQMIFSHKRLISAPIVGIINADTLINVPDFRAEESLFRQIYTLRQMAGRLIVQTHNPDDPAIKSAAAGQIEKFFEDEINCRREFNYPPFSSLVKLGYRHKDPNRGRLESSILVEKLKTQLRLTNDSARLIEIIGPAPAFIFKEKGLYHWLIILKLKSLDIKKRNDLLRFVPNGWVTDVDPKNVI